MLMLLIYIAVAAYLVSNAKRKGLASLYAVITFLGGYILFAAIGYLLINSGLVEFASFYEDKEKHERYQLARFVLGSFQIVFSLLILRVLINVKSGPKLKEISKALFETFRRAFRTEGQWRLYVVLQVIGIIVIVYLDMTNQHGWDFLPDLFDYNNHFRFEWSFFEERYWTRNPENWIALLCVLGPYSLTKSINWVQSAKSDS